MVINATFNNTCIQYIWEDHHYEAQILIHRSNSLFFPHKPLLIQLGLTPLSTIVQYIIFFLQYLPKNDGRDRSVVFFGYSGFFPYKTDHHDITEILLKVALNTTTLSLTPTSVYM